MDSEIEAEEQLVQRPKDPLRHFVPLEVSSFRGEQQAVTQRSVIVSLKTTAVPGKVYKRPGPFLNERRSLPNTVQAQMASGPGAADHLVYRAWVIKFDEDDQLKEDKIQTDDSRSG